MSTTSRPEHLKIACPFCSQKLDITDVPPFTNIECPACKRIFPAPRWLDGFLLEELLGEGPVSTVYRALDTRLDRDVAVKLLRPAAAEDGRHVEHFLAASRKMAQASHPRLLPIFTCGEADGGAYLVMPYMRKFSLARWLRDRREMVTPDFAIKVALNVAQGLEAALQQKSMIHGNVCPQNILLDDENEPRVGDFGLAHCGWNAERAAVENNAACHASFAYLSPELGLGGVGDERSDIFGLGAVLYHMLAGKAPFPDENSEAEFRRRQTDQPPALPPEVKVSSAVAELVASMLSGAPNHRPRGYGAIIAILEGNLKTRSTRPAGATDRKGDAADGGKRKIQLPVATPVAAAPPPAASPYLPPPGGQKRGSSSGALTAAIIIVLFLLGGVVFIGAKRHLPWYENTIGTWISGGKAAAHNPGDNTLPVPSQPGGEATPPETPAETPATTGGTTTAVTPPAAGGGETVAVVPASPEADLAPERPDGTPVKEPASTAVAETPVPETPEAAPETAANQEPEPAPRTPLVTPELETKTADAAPEFDTSGRPRPGDLNFAKVQAEVDRYIASLPEAARTQEQQRIRMISELRSEWMHSKISFDGKSGIRLKDGRTVRGAVMANDKEILIMGRDRKRPVVIGWDDLPTEQYIAFLTDNVMQKASRAGVKDTSAAVRRVTGATSTSSQRETLGDDYFRLAIVCDWYQKPADAKKYAAEAVKNNPKLAEHAKRFFPGAP